MGAFAAHFARISGCGSHLSQEDQDRKADFLDWEDHAAADASCALVPNGSDAESASVFIFFRAFSSSDAAGATLRAERQHGLMM